jgi:MOSC domain-containing protein YiiM
MGRILSDSMSAPGEAPRADTAADAPARSGGDGRDHGRVEAIFIRAYSDGPPQSLQRAEVDAHRGVRGDRYHADAPDGERSGRDLTLIEAEALAGLRSDTGIELTAPETGRNLLTRGIDLNALVGRRFLVGAVECVGRQLNEPCATLQGRTRPGVLRGLVGRGGLRADVLGDGEISVGDPIRAVG